MASILEIAKVGVGVSIYLGVAALEMLEMERGLLTSLVLFWLMKACSLQHLI